MSKATGSSIETLHTGLISEDSSVQNLDATKQLGSWRFTVRAGVAVASLVALANLGCFIWALTLDREDGSATVFEGSCDEVKRITFWVDLAINTLSTLLLGASNNCTQLLVAPTRKDIDDAHAAGRYLDVSVSSMRNLLAVSRWRKWLCACLFLSSIPLHLLTIDIRENIDPQTYTLARMWQDVVGTVSTDFLVGTGDHERSLMENVLLANTPQLAISVIYVSYNNCLTMMMLGQEYSGYARHRKPLRVSRPEGDQRSTYRLQLPYRYSVPLMASMATLHWLIARSIFLVEINVFDYNGNALAKRVSGCGYSPMAIVLSLFISGVIILALLASGARKLEPGIPLASSCSLAIAAACHTSPGDEDARMLPLKYGVMIAEEPDSVSEYEHACFSSKEVTPLVDGHLYS
ncbi:unnamed protein product [Aureobasidium uvarum]|uniref:DUF6536 domain-containing protein n=1 Tax=Aureobasidium uvarum TaxID=2773716 RepID=A0A9N8KH58_9PEZI|nr:unnamed protein product [Aureobasidium uvarum]